MSERGRRGIYAAGKRVGGWCCAVCHAEFDHSPRHRAARPARTFLRLARHKTFRLHRPFSYRIIGAPHRHVATTHVSPMTTWSTSQLHAVVAYYDWTTRPRPVVSSTPREAGD